MLCYLLSLEMKGASSSLLDEDRMHEIVNECCDLFLQKFPLSFEFALYDEYKRKNNAEPDELKLPQPPLQKFPLKDGWLYKRGDVSSLCVMLCSCDIYRNLFHLQPSDCAFQRFPNQ
jgi:hypothetical protein